MPTKTLLTSRDKKGLHIVSLFETAFNQAGLDDDGGQRIHERGDEFKDGVLKLLARLSATPLAHDRARQIMGKNFFGLEEAGEHFGIKPSKKDLADLATIPYSEAVLTACKDTHVLIAVLPFSLLDVRKKAAKELFFDQDWYNKEQFARDKGGARWYLVRKAPVENSTSKTWDEQQRLLSKDEGTPSARVVVYTIIGHFLATGERLFEKIYVRCSDLDGSGDRVDVGYFGECGLELSSGYWDGVRSDVIGLSSARKFDN